jgi:hypothetical protein
MRTCSLITESIFHYFFSIDSNPKVIRNQSITISNFIHKINASQMDPHLSFQFDMEFGNLIVWPYGRHLLAHLTIYFIPNMIQLKKHVVNHSHYFIQFQFQNHHNQCDLFSDGKAIIMASGSHLIFQILLDEDLMSCDEIQIDLSLQEKKS